MYFFSMILFVTFWDPFLLFFSFKMLFLISVFCTGSMEDRRYLRHEILNEDVEYNVIVTT